MGQFHDRREARSGVEQFKTQDRGRRVREAAPTASVQERVRAYLENYPSNHREKSVTFATQRLAHVKRLLGGRVLFDLTEDRIQEYIRTRLGEGVSGRTINMEVSSKKTTKWAAR